MVKVDRREARRPGEETILIRLGKVVEAIIRLRVPTPLTRPSSTIRDSIPI